MRGGSYNNVTLTGLPSWQAQWPEFFRGNFNFFNKRLLGNTVTLCVVKLGVLSTFSSLKYQYLHPPVDCLVRLRPVRIIYDKYCFTSHQSAQPSPHFMGKSSQVKSNRQDRQGRPGLSGILIANYSLDRIKNKNKMRTDIPRWLYNIPLISREKNCRKEIWQGRVLRWRTTNHLKHLKQ